MYISDPKLCPYEINTNKQLGRGTYGDVFAGYHRITNTPIAAKRVMRNNKDHLKTVMQEVNALQHIPAHKNIVNFRHTEKIEKSLWIMTDYCKYGDLNKHVQKNGLALQEKFTIMHDCTSAVCHLHGLDPPVVHRDIKPENVLLADDLGKVIAKVCDFGLAKITTRLDDGTIAMGTIC